MGGAEIVFEGETCARLATRVRLQALATPVFFTERLSNRVLAACLTLMDGSSAIAINARFKVDPEILTHALVEEFAHADQILAGVDFRAQQRQFSYGERPYEEDAKRIATETLGYEPGEYDAYLVRDEPDPPLFDG